MVMREFSYLYDSRMPANARIVGTGDEDDALVLERGMLDSGEKGAKIIDLNAAAADDDRVTSLTYWYAQHDGIYFHEFTGVHRHGPDHHPAGGEGECEHAPADEYPAPDIVIDILADALDAPVAGGGASD